MNKYKRLNCENQPKLFSSLKKYGFENFKVEILMDEIPECLLNDMEIEYIKKYNSFLEGLNCTDGGDGFSAGINHPLFGKKRPPFSEKTKLKQSKTRIERGLAKGENNAMYGVSIPCSEEKKKYMSNLMKGRSPWNKGKKLKPFTKDHKQKLSLAKKGKPNKLKGRPWSEKRRAAHDKNKKSSLL